MAEILLGQSYYLRFDPKLWELMQPYPPLGTLYAAAYLRQRGREVALFDAMLAADESDWEEALERERPGVAVLFEDNFNYLSKMCLLRMREASLKMIVAARGRGCRVLVCGSDASDHPEIFLEAGADFVLLGEGEETLGELVDALDEGEDRGREVPGVAFATRRPAARSEESVSSPHSLQVQRSPRRKVIDDLDRLPMPAWDLVDVERYRRRWSERHGRFSMNLVATRGCPFHCNWCAKPIWGQGYKMHSPGRVAAELAHLATTYRPDHVWFADDILGLKRGWMADLADELEARDLRLPFKCQSRVDLLLREGEVEAFRRAGAETVWVGAESGSQKILDAMDKGTRTEQIREASRRLHEAGIGIGFFLQFGYPGEDRSDIEKTRQLVRDCRPDEIGVSVSYPLPGTRFYELVREQLGAKQNWVDSSDLDMMYQGPFGTAFYRQLYRVLHREFRARRRARDLRRLLSRPGTLALRDLGEALVLGGQLLSLPWERWRLERCARRGPEQRLSIDSGMSPEEAAAPTPQA